MISFVGVHHSGRQQCGQQGAVLAQAHKQRRGRIGTPTQINGYNAKVYWVHGERAY